MEKAKIILAQIFLSKRARSFYWRTLMMAIAGLTAIISEELVNIDISTTQTVLLGLVFGEISKAVRNIAIEMENEGQI